MCREHRGTTNLSFMIKIICEAVSSDGLCSSTYLGMSASTIGSYNSLTPPWLGGKRGLNYSECMGFWPNSNLCKADFKSFKIFLDVLLISFTQRQIRSLQQRLKIG